MKQETHRARKRFGQNFLQDATIIERIVAAINADAKRYMGESGSHFVEIGPGLGALTKPLIASQAGNNDWQFTLIELDRDLASKLHQEFEAQNHINIVQTDALKLNFGELAGNASASLQLFGNLPYNISTPLLFHLLHCNDAHLQHSGKPLFNSMIFMLQKEVVDRLIATPNSKAYGRLSVMTQYHCEVDALFDVPPSAFQPQPKVTSAMVRLKPHLQRPVTAKDESLLAEVVQKAFAQRRKTLRNNLKQLMTDDQFEALSIDPSRRAETLALADYIAISNALYDRGSD